MELTYRKGLMVELADGRSLSVRKFSGKYVVSILDKNTLKLTTKEFASLRNLNKFLSQFTVA